MEEADRKLAWSGIFVLAVIALEFAWFLFVGPTNYQPNYNSKCSADCDIPWWGSSAFWTAFFTLALFVSTALLWWQTKRLWETGEKQIGAIQANERPWVVVESYSVIRGEYGDIRHALGFLMDIKLINLGRAPAIIDEFTWKFEEVRNLSALPDYSNSMRFVVSNTLASGATTETNRGVGPSPDIGEEFVEGSKRPTRWAVFGRIAYREMAGPIHYTGYAVEILTPSTGTFPIGGSAYNYST